VKVTVEGDLMEKGGKAMGDVSSSVCGEHGRSEKGT
jgi:hypothetical protein